MPGYILHLYVGNELAKAFAKKRDLFIAGNLAPDAVHARKPYDRNHKKISHLKNGFRDRQLTNKVHQSIFENGLDVFIQNIQTIQCHEKKEFYSGYIAHVLTDYFFIRNILDDIYQKCADQKYNSNEQLVTGRDFIEEYIAMDGVVLDIFPELQEVLKTIEKSKAFDVENYVSENEVLISREWTIKQIRSEKDFEKELKYFNKSDLLTMFEDSIEFVMGYLKRYDLQKMIC